MTPTHQESTQSTISTRLKVGVFTFITLILIGIATVLVNDRPFWWKPCQEILIDVEDATGLKSKSAVRSLGIDIGFLKEVNLYQEKVQLHICVTAPVEILPETKAYIRAEGFLGDKFVDLKPVKRRL